ncbi:hypothetical protein F5Y15DRAFT_234764 [Xylariaceae sp. FL0016]|nr:hypothetical protein F5Y15DRAFT_234764 [Xylariaceae sp. FL0016]
MIERLRLRFDDTSGLKRSSWVCRPLRVAFHLSLAVLGSHPAVPSLTVSPDRDIQNNFIQNFTVHESIAENFFFALIDTRAYIASSTQAKDLGTNDATFVNSISSSIVTRRYHTSPITYTSPRTLHLEQHLNNSKNLPRRSDVRISGNATNITSLLPVIASLR